MGIFLYLSNACVVIVIANFGMDMQVTCRIDKHHHENVLEGCKIFLFFVRCRTLYFGYNFSVNFKKPSALTNELSNILTLAFKGMSVAKWYNTCTYESQLLSTPKSRFKSHSVDSSARKFVSSLDEDP